VIGTAFFAVPCHFGGTMFKKFGQMLVSNQEGVLIPPSYDEVTRIKDIDTKQGIVQRYGSTFGIRDSHGDRTMKGCFNRTLNTWGPKGKNRIKALAHHNPTQLVSKITEIQEDSTGLLLTEQFIPTQLSKDTLTLIEYELLTESSIGYSVKREKYNEEEEVNELLEVILYEVSYVSWGSLMETPVVSVKSDSLINPENDDVFTQMKSMEKALRNGTFETDEIPTMLELALAMWEGKLKALTKTPEIEKITLTTADSTAPKPLSPLSEKDDTLNGSQLQGDTDDLQADTVDDPSEIATKEALNDLLISMQLSKLQLEAQTLRRHIKGEI